MSNIGGMTIAKGEPGEAWFGYSQCESPCESSFLVSYIGDEIVGAVAYAPFGTRGISGLGVHPAHRRRGIAEALWRAAAERMGCDPSEVLPIGGLSSEAAELAKKMGVGVERR